MDDKNSARVFEILGQVKALAKEYRALTGRPLGCTGEIAEYEAARILGLALSPVRQAGYDAIRQSDGAPTKVQIKGRCMLPDSSSSQRLGSIDIKKEWDAVLLVLLDENLDATVIWDAPRDAVVTALKAPGSKARNERGALAVSKFKSIGKMIWRRDQ